MGSTLDEDTCGTSTDDWQAGQSTVMPARLLDTFSVWPVGQQTWIGMALWGETNERLETEPGTRTTVWLSL